MGNIQSEREYIHVKDASYAAVQVLRKKYDNRYFILTGLRKIKVKNLMKKVKAKFKINSKIKFLNRKFTGHYIRNPTTYKLRVGEKFAFRKQRNIYNEIYKLGLAIKKKRYD